MTVPIGIVSGAWPEDVARVTHHILEREAGRLGDEEVDERCTADEDAAEDEICLGRDVLEGVRGNLLDDELGEPLPGAGKDRKPGE